MGAYVVPNVLACSLVLWWDRNGSLSQDGLYDDLRIGSDKYHHSDPFEVCSICTRREDEYYDC